MMMKFAKRALTAMAAASVLLLMGVHDPSQAQTYPNRPVRIVVPLVPGGGVDFVARVTAEKLSQAGYSAIVDNRPGGATNIGMEYVARASLRHER